MLRSLLAAAALAVAPACRTAPESLPDDGAPGRTVEVKPGQTVFDLARESGLSVEEIVEVNGLASAEDVAPGDRIFLPAGAHRGAPRPPPAPVEPERAEPAHETSSVLAWPVDGVVLRAFSTTKARGGPYEGVLIAAPAGTSVRAAAGGRVAFAGEQGTAYGRFVVVEHDDGLVTVYAHLESLGVKEGVRIERGAILGVIGTSGGQESPRLHFQVRRGRTPIDPEPLLPP